MDLSSITAGLSLPTILPTPNIPTSTPGVFGPDYSFSDSIPLPSEIGVGEGNTIASVISSAKAASFYVDTIGFGAPSSKWSNGFSQLKPLGVNTFIRSGQTCSNGADTWSYLEGIPTGNALGKRMAEALSKSGMPPMRGLAPGILEDVQAALDPVPVMSAVFGTGNPVCSYQYKQVGDQDGVVRNPATKAYYVENPEDVKCSDGSAFNMESGKCPSGLPIQARWVKTGQTTSSDTSKGTFCPSGWPKQNYKDRDCLKDLVKKDINGFEDYGCSREMNLLKIFGIGAGIIFAVSAVYSISSKLKGK